MRQWACFLAFQAEVEKGEREFGRSFVLLLESLLVKVDLSLHRELVFVLHQKAVDFLSSLLLHLFKLVALLGRLLRFLFDF